MILSKEEILKISYEDGRVLPENLEEIIKCQEDASLRSPGLPAHYYRFLFRLCELKKPEIVLELGTSYGHSSACMADGNPEGKVITVNDHDELRDECWRININYRMQDSLEKVILGRKIDILFIDTRHDGIRCLDEFSLYEKDVDDKGIVLIDDIHLFPCMDEFWLNFNPPGWEKVELPIHGGAGFGCLIKSPLRAEEE